MNRAFTEDEVAELFAEKNAQRFRFDHIVAVWYVWTGTTWKPDFPELKHAIRMHGRALADQQGIQASTQAGRNRFVEGVERFCRTDPRFSVFSDVWDRQPLLLGTPGGVVELENGLLRAASPDDMITKSTAVTPSADAHCPRWLDFLEQITQGDHELFRFLKRWFGYCLTAEVKEQKLLFAHGSGGNGKSVLFGIISRLLADYAYTAPGNLFTASKLERHSTGLAALRGARFVSASEIDAGSSWDEALIKRLTGGDDVAARRMRQDDQTFAPTWKISIVANVPPQLRSVDDAMRRRFLILPLTYRPAEPDRDLPEKLKAEGPGILRWVIEGCLEWQKEGLGIPQAIKDASAEYFAEQDTVGRWLGEACDVEAGNVALSAKPTSLLRSYKTYCMAEGLEPLGRPSFLAALKQRGLYKSRTSSDRLWVGLRLKSDVSDIT